MTVHVLSTRAVVAELRRGPIDANLAFRYLAMWLVLTAALTYYDAFLIGPPDSLSIVQAVAGVLITIYGLFQCYVANGGADGKDLLGRFVALSLPITVKLQIAYEAIYWFSYLMYPRITVSLSEADYELIWRRASVVLATVYLIIWYSRLRTWILRVNVPTLRDSSSR